MVKITWYSFQHLILCYIPTTYILKTLKGRVSFLDSNWIRISSSRRVIMINKMVLANCQLTSLSPIMGYMEADRRLDMGGGQRSNFWNKGRPRFDDVAKKGEGGLLIYSGDLKWKYHLTIDARRYPIIIIKGRFAFGMNTCTVHIVLLILNNIFILIKFSIK